MKISFFGGLAKTRYVDVSNQICSNLFLETAAGGQVGALYGTPGLNVIISGLGPIRGMIVVGPYVYFVNGDVVSRSDVSGTDTANISRLYYNTGKPVCMACNGTQIAIVDGSDVLTLIALDTLVTTSVALYYRADRIRFLDGYFVVNAIGTRRFYISALYNGASWNSLSFASIEGSTDDLLSLEVTHRQCWFFKKHATEVWYNSGDSFPIARVSGVYLEEGTAATHSPGVIDNTVYWLSNRGTVLKASDYVPEIVSTREIESMIAELGTIDDAIGMTFGIQGHYIYQLKFPTGGLTLAYDISNGSWFKRTSGQHEANFTGNCYAMIGNTVLVGDDRGNLCKQEMSCYTDSGLGANIREASTQHLADEGYTLRYNKFRLALVGANGGTVAAMLTYSDDGGHTWQGETWRGFGHTGEPATTPRHVYPFEWHMLGASRKRQFKIRISDSWPVCITEATFEAEKWGQ